MATSDNFAHWQALARREGATLAATTRCQTIKVLEIDAFVREIATQRPDLAGGGSGCVLELGCGVGINLLGIQAAYPHLSYVGCDLVPEMVANAAALADERLADDADLRSRLQFAVADVRSVIWPPKGLIDPPGAPDIVLTDRCLINLGSMSEQAEAVRAICGQLATDGRFLMLENSAQAADGLDLVREALGLPPKIRAEFNVFIDEESLIEAVGDRPLAVRDFAGLHDLILYGVDAAGRNGQHIYDTDVMERVTAVNLALNAVGIELPTGQNRLWVWGP